MNFLIALSNGLLRSSEVLFKPSCLVCKSASTDILCHRCKLPPAVHLEQSLRCKVCYELIPNGLVCNLCIQQQPLYSRARYLWDYSANARDFCVALKYKPSIKLISYAADILSKELDNLFPDNSWDYIIPIPASQEGFMKRGYNHVEILARRLLLKSGLNIKILNHALLPQKRRRPQASLSNQRRIRGIKSRFSIGPKHRKLLKGKRILLLDDVMTTGATLQSACLALNKSGVCSIDILTICRSPACFLHRAELSN